MTGACAFSLSLLLLVTLFRIVNSEDFGGDEEVCLRSAPVPRKTGKGGQVLLIQRAFHLGEDRVRVDMQEPNTTETSIERMWSSTGSSHIVRSLASFLHLDLRDVDLNKAPQADDLEWWERPLLSGGVFVGVLLFTCLLVRFCVTAPPSTSAKLDELERLRTEQGVLQKSISDLDELMGPARPSSGSSGAKEMTDAQLQQEVHLATVQADATFRRSIHTAIERVAPPIVKVQKVKSCVENRIVKAKDQADALVRHHASTFLDRCLHTLGVEDAASVSNVISKVLQGKSAEVASEAAEHIVGRVESQVEHAAELPAEVVLAGLAAPLQLQLTASWSRLQLAVSTFFLLVFTVVMAFETGRRCGAETLFSQWSLWYWVLGLTFILFFQVVCRLALLASATAALEETRNHNAVLAGKDSLLMSLRKTIIASEERIFIALEKYDEIARSCSSWMLGFLNSFHIIWGSVGLGWCIWNAVDNTIMCDAVHLRFVVHVYVFMYTVLLTITIPAFVLRLAYSCISCGCMQNVVLHGSKFADKQLAIGVPVVSIVARAFLLRSAIDIWDSEKTMLRGEVDELQTRRTDLTQRLASLNAALHDKHAELHQMIDARESIPVEVEPESDGLGVAAILRQKKDDAADVFRQTQASAAEASQRGKEAARIAATESAIAALARAKQVGVDLHAVSRRCQATTSV